jgi:hypothetical protein
MFGDSLMGIQLRHFFEVWADTNQWGKRIWAYMADTSGGLAMTGAEVNATIEAAALHEKETGGATAIWFNSGLHDIDKYCGQGRWR